MRDLRSGGAGGWLNGYCARGKIGGTIIGTFVIGVLPDGLVMVQVSSFWKTLIKGLVIIAAVVIDQAQRRVQARVALQQQSGL